MMYGMVMENAAKRPKRQTLRPSANERFSPKNRVMKPSTMSGTSVPAIACRNATFMPIIARKSAHS